MRNHSHKEIVINVVNPTALVMLHALGLVCAHLALDSACHVPNVIGNYNLLKSHSVCVHVVYTKPSVFS